MQRHQPLRQGAGVMPHGQRQRGANRHMLVPDVERHGFGMGEHGISDSVADALYLEVGKRGHPVRHAGVVLPGRFFVDMEGEDHAADSVFEWAKVLARHFTPGGNFDAGEILLW